MNELRILDREQSLSSLHESQARLEELIARLDDAAFAERGTIGGGEWSGKDLVAHVAAWEELALDLAESHAAGRRPRVSEVFKDPEGAVDRFNLEVFERSRAATPDEVRSHAREVHTRLIELIARLTPAQWAEHVGYRDEASDTLGSFMGGITGGPEGPFRHAFAHLGDLGALVAARADPAHCE
jgi:hypothetical protein